MQQHQQLPVHQQQHQQHQQQQHHHKHPHQQQQPLQHHQHFPWPQPPQVHGQKYTVLPQSRRIAHPFLILCACEEKYLRRADIFSLFLYGKEKKHLHVAEEAEK
jgi:hypothetical protein